MNTLTTQQMFDEKYISTNEISQLLNVSRTAIFYAKRKGWLPDVISVNDGQLFIWERERIKPYLENWDKQLKRHRGE